MPRVWLQLLVLLIVLVAAHKLSKWNWSWLYEPEYCDSVNDCSFYDCKTCVKKLPPNVMKIIFLVARFNQLLFHLQLQSGFPIPFPQCCLCRDCAVRCQHCDWVVLPVLWPRFCLCCDCVWYYINIWLSIDCCLYTVVDLCKWAVLWLHCHLCWTVSDCSDCCLYCDCVDCCL